MTGCNESSLKRHVVVKSEFFFFGPNVLSSFTRGWVMSNVINNDRIHFLPSVRALHTIYFCVFPLLPFPPPLFLFSYVFCLVFVLGNSHRFSALIPHHTPQVIVVLRCYLGALRPACFCSFSVHVCFSAVEVCACVYVSTAAELHSQISLWFVWATERSFLKQLKDVVEWWRSCVCVRACVC